MRTSKSVDDACAKLVAGEIGFNEFATLTNYFWEYEANALIGRYEVPYTVTVDDVKQEMLLAAWRSIERWDATRGTLQARMVFFAVRDARRWLNGQRGVMVSRGDKMRSRCASLLSVADMTRTARIAISPVQQEVVEAFEAICRVMAQLPPESRFVLQVLARFGDPRVAAKWMYSDERTQCALGIPSRRMAYRKVTQVMRRTAKLMGVSDG